MKMPDKIVEIEPMKIELDIRMSEYQALRDEINLTLNAAFRTTNITFTGIGIVFAASPYIVQSGLIALFALIAIAFYALAWTQLRYARQILNLSNHIIEVTSPRIRELVRTVSPEHSKSPDSILSWESGGRTSTHSTEFWLMPIEAARYGLPILSAVVSFGVYCLLVFQNSWFTFLVDGPLILLNAFLLIYTGFVTLKMRKQLGNQSIDLYEAR
jgi:hypothetical protein